MGAWPVESKGEKKNSSTQRDKKNWQTPLFGKGWVTWKKLLFFPSSRKETFLPRLHNRHCRRVNRQLDSENWCFDKLLSIFFHELSSLKKRNKYVHCQEMKDTFVACLLCFCFCRRLFCTFRKTTSFLLGYELTVTRKTNQLFCSCCSLVFCWGFFPRSLPAPLFSVSFFPTLNKQHPQKLTRLFFPSFFPRIRFFFVCAAELELHTGRNCLKHSGWWKKLGFLNF